MRCDISFSKEADRSNFGSLKNDQDSNMRGLMQDKELIVTDIIDYAATWHGDQKVMTALAICMGDQTPNSMRKPAPELMSQDHRVNISDLCLHPNFQKKKL